MDWDYWVHISGPLLRGAGITLKLYLVTLLLAIPLGFILALMKTSRIKLFRIFVGGFTWLVRGTPLLLQLFFVYYGLGMVAANHPQYSFLAFSAFTAAVLTFTINYAAYFTEIYRSGIESVDAGQYEAARALNMSSFQTMYRIILPQVIRRTLPPVCNEAIVLVKDTALIATISIGELLRSAKEIVSSDFTVVPFILAGVIYLLISSVVVWIFRRLEYRYTSYERG
jgi:polar amino acid transport system permease protein